MGIGMDDGGEMQDKAPISYEEKSSSGWGSAIAVGSVLTAMLVGSFFYFSNKNSQLEAQLATTKSIDSLVTDSFRNEVDSLKSKLGYFSNFVKGDIGDGKEIWTADDIKKIRLDVNRANRGVKELEQEYGAQQEFIEDIAGIVSVNYGELQEGIKELDFKVGGLEKGIDNRFHDMRIYIDERTGKFDSVKNEVYNVLASQMDVLAHKHNNEVVFRTQGIPILNSVFDNGYALPYFTKAGRITNKGAENFYSLLEQHVDIHRDIENLSYKILDEGKHIANYILEIQEFIGPLFNDHLLSNNRYRHYGGGQTHHDAVSPDLLEKIKK